MPNNGYDPNNIDDVLNEYYFWASNTMELGMMKDDALNIHSQEELAEFVRKYPNHVMQWAADDDFMKSLSEGARETIYKTLAEESNEGDLKNPSAMPENDFEGEEDEG